jgi:hypothetical protein
LTQQDPEKDIGGTCADFDGLYAIGARLPSNSTNIEQANNRWTDEREHVVSD